MLRNNKKILFLAILSILGASSTMAENVNSTFETSAKIENFCSINSNNINFGVVNLPLTAQEANGEIKVLCSNNTNYTVELNYGTNASISGTPNLYSQIGEYKNMSFYGSQSYMIYSVTNNETKFVNSFNCYSSGTGHQILINSGESFFLEALNAEIGTKVEDTIGACSLEQTQLFAKLAGVGEVLNGVMKGAIKKDSLAYKIVLPGDNSKIWSKGANAYQGVGNGLEQKINMSAKIVPGSSTSTYIAADTYLDTITAIVSY